MSVEIGQVYEIVNYHGIGKYQVVYGPGSSPDMWRMIINCALNACEVNIDFHVQAGLWRLHNNQSTKHAWFSQAQENVTHSWALVSVGGGIVWSAEDELRRTKERADTANNWREQYYKADGSLRTANDRIRDLERQLASSTRANTKLKAALKAATGNEEIEEIDHEHPVVNGGAVAYGRATNTASVNYPWDMLEGSRDIVLKQALACFVDDPERRNKIGAIKTMRERTGLGLKESKDLVEWAIETVRMR